MRKFRVEIVVKEIEVDASGDKIAEEVISEYAVQEDFEQSEAEKTQDAIFWEWAADRFRNARRQFESSVRKGVKREEERK